MNGNRSSALPLFLTGLGTGISLTFLLAPRSGAATRSLIGRKVKDGEDWMKDKAAPRQKTTLLPTQRNCASGSKRWRR